MFLMFCFFQAEDGIRDLVRSRGLGDVYKRQGVLCGRATWQDGIPVFATGGFDALVAWLEDRGVQNITALNQVLAKGAKPWWDFYGGKSNLEIVG